MRQTMPFPRRNIPRLARVAQRFSTGHITEVRATVKQKLWESRIGARLWPGARIAITAGSRGMGAFAELLAGIVEAVKAAGGDPFLVPAMGSHGGATPAGQTELLHRLGICEEAVGAPIQATLQTRVLGTASSGARAHLDAWAAAADGIIVLGRVKTHPENTEGVASGLLKMVTVGLGKQAGAQQAHAHGLWESVKAVPQITLSQANILCGVAVVENAYRQPVEIEVVPPRYDAFKEADERLLNVARAHLATLPFTQLDLLVVDQLGKNISGTGMDLNVIGPWRVSGGTHQPDFRRIVALRLTRESLGNGLGIGLADFTTQRLRDEYDPAVTYVNLLTATEPGSRNTREGGLPLALASDREAIEVALYSALTGTQPRVCRIESTARLDEFWVSEALLGEVAQQAALQVLEPLRSVEFDDADNLL